MRLGGFPQRIACCDRHTNPAPREVPIQPCELPRTRDHVEGLHAECASLRGHRLDAVRVHDAPQEIADARTDWEERRRFGEVTGYPGPRLAAPSLVKFANPNPAS